LDLRNKQLVDISPKLWQQKQLLVIDLSGNPGLSVIPNEISSLKNLRTLRWSGNGVTQLPSGLLELEDLDTLELNKNKLTGFYRPETPHRFNSLTYLSLNGNKISEVPGICKTLPKLQQLHLHMNCLTNVREMCRSSYSKLEVLDVGNNKI
jgi:Leucine-rich repeat (LRR) protein